MDESRKKKIHQYREGVSGHMFTSRVLDRTKPHGGRGWGVRFCIEKGKIGNSVCLMEKDVYFNISRK